MSDHIIRVYVDVDDVERECQLSFNYNPQEEDYFDPSNDCKSEIEIKDFFEIIKGKKFDANHLITNGYITKDILETRAFESLD